MAAAVAAVMPAVVAEMIKSAAAKAAAGRRRQGPCRAANAWTHTNQFTLHASECRGGKWAWGKKPAMRAVLHPTQDGEDAESDGEAAKPLGTSPFP